MTEAEFQRQVTDLAELTGWAYVHFRPAKTAHGWRTPVQGTLGGGWPDLFLVNPWKHRTLVVELKTDKGKVTPEQAAVHTALRSGGLTVFVWRPADFPEIQRELTA